MNDTRGALAVTGVGILCGLGLDLSSSWQGAVAGERPVRRFTLFDPQGLATPFGVELPPEAEALFRERIKPRARSQMSRATMIGVCAAAEAVERSALGNGGMDPTRVGVVIGATGTGYVAPAEGADPHRILGKMANAPAAWVSLRHKFTGPAMVVSTACSSGVYAMQMAHLLIATGQCDAVVTGAVSSTINRLDVEGFGALMALAVENGDVRAASRPFDRRRNGFVMGEGAGILVLESPASARARGAEVLALSHLPALTSEAYNILSPRPAGEGMAEVMRRALAHAGLREDEIDYVNAHGTSTALNDLYETQAIKQVFGDRAARLPVSSTKSMTGHCLAGAAGVEAVLCVQALREGMIPPTMNLEEPDPELDLDYVPGVARPASLRHVLSNSFAFGGHNGAQVFSAASEAVE